MKNSYCKLGFIQFPILTFLAMLIHTNYNFTHNFLSDLGRISNIENNFVSWIFFTFSMIILGLSLILFYSENIWGIISGTFFICVALSPIDLFPFLHMLFAILAFILLTIASIQAELRILTGVLITFFFNFLIPGSLMIQVLNQKFAFYSMIILHLNCLFDVPFHIKQYYRKFQYLINFAFEENSFFHEKKVMELARFLLDI